MQFPRPNKLTVTIAEKKYLTDKVIQIVFKLPEPIEFLPGQFISITVADGAKRSYSIAQGDSDTTIETYVDISPGGVGSKFFEAVEVGQEVEAVFPLGRFVYKPNTNPVYLVATGTGLVPLKSMISAELQKEQSGRQITLVFGVRHYKDLFLEEYFGKLEAEHSNFQVKFCLSGEQKEGFFEGRVTGYIDTNDFEENLEMYICGGKNMISDVKDSAMKKGIAEENIHYEQFF